MYMRKILLHRIECHLRLNCSARMRATWNNASIRRCIAMPNTQNKCVMHVSSGVARLTRNRMRREDPHNYMVSHL